MFHSLLTSNNACEPLTAFASMSKALDMSDFALSTYFSMMKYLEYTRFKTMSYSLDRLVR
jgi:hypothetical protein